MYEAGADLYKEAKQKAVSLSKASISMSNLSISGNTISFKVSNKTYTSEGITKKYYDSYKIYINGTDKTSSATISGNNVSIDVSGIDTDTVEVKVVAYVDLYKVGYRVLVPTSGTVSQRLLAVTVVDNSTPTSASTTPPQELEVNTDVSLQKYITHVNGSSVASRKNQMTKSSESNTDVKKPNISKSNSATIPYKYKYDSAVNIEAGDTVTYRIYVYNNSTVKASEILIKDRLPYYMKSDDSHKADKNRVKYLAASVERITKGASSTDIKSSWTEETEASTGGTNGCKIIKYTLTDLAGGTETYFDVTLKFDTYLTGVLTNTAWISSSTPNNSETYRTADRDYVQMPSDYGVSLEKYVTKVGETSISGRNGHPTYEDENIPNYYKKIKNGTAPGAVEVDVGDEVIYTLKLTNTTSSDKSIKINQIKDSFDNRGLKFIEVVDGSYGGAYKNSESTSGNRTTLEINTVEGSRTEIAKGSSVYIYLKFEVIGEGLIENVAEVTKISNKNNVEVTDNDEAGRVNNTDRDWLKTKDYSVSLEKYVTKVNESPVSGRDGHPIYNEATTKSDSPVDLEVGDLVTYTIRLTNTTDYKLKVTEVIDELDRRLTYREDIGITGSGYGSPSVVRDGNK